MIVQTEQGAPITAKVNRRVLLSCAMAWKTNKGQHLNIVSVSLSLYCAVSVTFVIIVNIIITIIIIASVNPRFQGSNPRLYNPRFHVGNPRLNQPQILSWQPQTVQPQILHCQPQTQKIFRAPRGSGAPQIIQYAPDCEVLLFYYLVKMFKTKEYQLCLSWIALCYWVLQGEWHHTVGADYALNYM